MSMIAFTAGQPFPLAYRSADGMTAMLDGAALSFVISMSGITHKEAQAVKKAKPRLALFVREHVPFVAVDFPGCASLDAYINIYREPQERRDAFLAGAPGSNLLTWYLVDWRTGILRAIRVIGAAHDLLPGIKSACFEQLTAYPDAAAVDAAANRIIARYTTAELLAAAAAPKQGRGGIK